MYSIRPLCRSCPNKIPQHPQRGTPPLSGWGRADLSLAQQHIPPEINIEEVMSAIKNQKFSLQKLIADIVVTVRLNSPAKR